MRYLSSKVKALKVESSHSSKRWPSEFPSAKGLDYWQLQSNVPLKPENSLLAHERRACRTAQFASQHLSSAWLATAGGQQAAESGLGTASPGYGAPRPLEHAPAGLCLETLSRSWEGLFGSEPLVG